MKRSSNSPAVSSRIDNSGHCDDPGSAGHAMDVRGSCHDPPS
jgi:hypothetical protein